MLAEPILDVRTRPTDMLKRNTRCFLYLHVWSQFKVDAGELITLAGGTDGLSLSEGAICCANLETRSSNLAIDSAVQHGPFQASPLLDAVARGRVGKARRDITGARTMRGTLLISVNNE